MIRRVGEVVMALLVLWIVLMPIVALAVPQNVSDEYAASLMASWFFALMALGVTAWIYYETEDV